jgi:predicted amidohydrolase
VTPARLRIAVGQFDPDQDHRRNAAQVSDFAARAVAGGARLLLLPEGSLVRFLDDPGAPQREAQSVDGPFGSAVVAASDRFGLGIAVGSFTPGASTGDRRRVRNTLLIADRGQLVSTYHKVHLYDAFSYLESDGIEPGDSTPPVVTFEGISVGFATCYDLRFPELFRVLVDRGAQVLALPSAWVVGPLKEEHWLTLLRARAIENTCYSVAADQFGRRSIGRSAAFDPMGMPLLDLGSRAPVLGFIDVDSRRVEEARTALPCLANRRFPVMSDPVAAQR